MRLSTLVLLAAGVCFAVISCNNIKQKDYSFVETIQINDTLKRSELVMLNIAEQRKIFNSLSPSMKCDLYKYKISKDLQSDKLNDKEKEHLEKLLQKISPESYSTNREEFNSWGEKWMEYAKTNLNWTEEELFKYSMVIMTIDEFDAYKKSMTMLSSPDGYSF